MPEPFMVPGTATAHALVAATSVMVVIARCMSNLYFNKVGVTASNSMALQGCFTVSTTFVSHQSSC